MNERLLKGMAVVCRMLSLFPFVVLTEASVGEFVWWHYPVFFVMTVLFYAAGYLAGKISGAAADCCVHYNHAYA